MNEFIEPEYGGRTLADVVPAVRAALGFGPAAGHPPEAPHGAHCAQPAASELQLPEASSYVVFLVDGLGADLLTRYAHAAPYLASLDPTTGTAGVPSTTATSLTSFGTALPPGAHGLVGFTSRIPGTDRLLDALRWSRDVDPVEWQPHDTALAGLRRAGAHVTMVNKREFEDSGLTRASARGIDYVGANLAGERIAAAVSASRDRPSLTYLYDGDLDWTGHKFGVSSSQWLQQLSMIDAQLEHLREALPNETRLVVVADHGMLDSPLEHRLDIDEVPGLRDGVALLGGEARFRHVYCRSGAVDDVAATWAEVLGERALVQTRSQAIARGWFGPVSPHVLPRLGDVMVACRSDYALMSSADFGYEMTLVGLHGSLTPVEMRIPILVD